MTGKQHKYIVEVTDLTVSYFGRKAFENISFAVAPSQMIGIIGPNGSGKSSLLKAIMGLLQVDQGRVMVMDQPVHKTRKHIAYIPQRSTIDMDFPVLVEEVVMMGRFPHMPWWGRAKAKDYAIAADCLKKVDMYEYRKRQIGQLSGGQQQRVFLARALAQGAELFFLDEPFAGIDIASEEVIVNILKELRNEGKTLFVVHHDLNKAERYFDSLVLLKNRLIAFGKKEEVFQIDRLKEAYDGKVSTINIGSSYMVVSS